MLGIVIGRLDCLNLWGMNILLNERENKSSRNRLPTPGVWDPCPEKKDSSKCWKSAVASKNPFVSRCYFKAVAGLRRWFGVYEHWNEKSFLQLQKFGLGPFCRAFWAGALMYLHILRQRYNIYHLNIILHIFHVHSTPQTLLSCVALPCVNSLFDPVSTTGFV